MSNNFQRKPNYTYTILSVALVLFLLGFFGTLMLQTQGLIKYFKENVLLLAELEEGMEKVEIDSFLINLKNENYIIPESIEFTDRVTAFEEAKESLGEEIESLDLGNPYYDVVSFKLNSDYLETSKVELIVSDLESKKGVREVFYQKGLVNDIGNSVNDFGKIGILISVILVFVAMGIIYSTIKLAIYSNRFLIKNMQLAGATFEFISRPFWLRSLRHGLISGGIAVFCLILVFSWINAQIPNWSLLNFDTATIFFLIFLVLIGVCITTFSTIYTVQKYLRSNIDDLH